MTEKDIQLVQKSFTYLIPEIDDLGIKFYEVLFEKYPTLKGLFEEDIEKQSKKLTEILTYAISGLDNLYILVPIVRDLGKRHKNYKVIDEHYNMVGDAFLFVLAFYFQDKWTDDLKQAWTNVYVLLADTMKKGAAEA